MTPEERVLRARIAAHTRWSRETDRAGATASARRAALDRFEKQVDPDGVMEPRQRAVLAENARKAHFTKMALRSAQARRKRSA